MNQKKLRPNAVCWCGSGKKYKHCHRNISRGPNSQTSEQKKWSAEKEHRDAFSYKTCFVPEVWRALCSNKTVRAHTVPKSGSLQKIARDGHVYGFIPSIQNLEKHDGIIPPTLVGVNKASTFTGFCSVHDGPIFAKIETEDFRGTPEQCFLLGYRALSREIYTKTAQASSFLATQSLVSSETKKRRNNLDLFQMFHGAGIKAALRDNAIHKDIYDGILLNKDFSKVRAYLVELANFPKVMCSGGFFPEQDFAGANLQDLANLKITPDFLTISSFGSGNKGFVVFSWTEESDRVCIPMAETLHSIQDVDLSSYLVRCMFEHIENVFLEPSWWEGLDQEMQEALIQRMAGSANPFNGRRENALVDDGVRVGEWDVTRRATVGFQLHS